MRIFIGIALPPNIKNHCANAQQQLKESGISGLYPSFNNFHLTLLYIGECTHAQTEAIIEAIATIECEPFAIDLNQIDFFVKKKATIAYLQVSKSKQLLALRKQIVDLIKTTELKIEIPSFTPHITLAKNFRLKEQPSTIFALKNQTMLVDQIQLFESKRIANHLVYESIATVDLI